jgi:hypothetical protein
MARLFGASAEEIHRMRIQNRHPKDYIRRFYTLRPLRRLCECLGIDTGETFLRDGFPVFNANTCTAPYARFAKQIGCKCGTNRRTAPILRFYSRHS